MSYIKITLRSDLCSGSGEAFGQSIDSDICFDKFGLPIIPARRLKGCLREAAVDLQKIGIASESDVDSVFGKSGESDSGALLIKDAHLSDSDIYINAINEKTVVSDEATALLTSVRAQTRLTAEGCADENSLRFTRVTNHYNPLNNNEENVFRAEAFCDEQYAQFLKNVCKALRHIGMNRNRGLGAVSCEYVEDGNCENKKPIKDELQKSCEGLCGELTLKYKIKLDSPLTLPDKAGGSEDYIDAKSVIGCFANQYIKLGGEAESEEFKSLFLNGDVKWSSLYISDGENEFYPAPLFLVKRKYTDTGKSAYANDLSNAVPGEAQAKALSSYYAAKADNGYIFTKPQNQSQYHHSKDENSTLYIQESLKENQIFSGTVTFDNAYKEDVINLLTDAKIAFGRSKSAQYASCALLNADITESDKTTVTVKKDELVYAVLKSDLYITDENGVPSVSNDAVKAVINKALNSNFETAEDLYCNCQYKTMAGFQAIWRLQKNSRRVVKAGSVYCLKAKNELTVPTALRLGENLQECCGVIELIPQSEMKLLSDVTKVSPGWFSSSDKEVSPDDCKKLEDLIKIRRLSESANKETYIFFDANKSALTKLSASFIGRLALMLKESTSYDNFIERIESVKDKKKRQTAIQIFDKFVTHLSGVLNEDTIAVKSQFNVLKDAFKMILSYTKYELRVSKSSVKEGENND